MKKITAILLMICLGFCAAGYHFVFRYQVWEAKLEMKLRLTGGLDQNHITEFSFTGNDLKEIDWENDHEFSFRGEMFDLVEQSSMNGVQIIRCIPDTKESALIDEYIRVNKNNSDNKPLSSLVQLISAQFIKPSLTALHDPGKIIESIFYSYSSTISSVLRSIHTPPPELC